jgi:hypothetical protein
VEESRRALHIAEQEGDGPPGEAVRTQHALLLQLLWITPVDLVRACR